MEAKKLKEYILDDIDRLYRVLNNYGFHDIKKLNGEIRCALPEGTNPTGVMIKLNENMYTAMFELGFTGDIFGAIGEVEDKTFKRVMEEVHSLFGLPMKGSANQVTVDPLKMLKQFASIDPYTSFEKENKKYGADILNKYIPEVPASVYEEGITPKVVRQFMLCYDTERDRVLFPHFDWEETDKVVGIKGRTILTAEEIEMTGVPKYWNYITGYRKMQNLYGFNFAKENLEACKMLVLFEGEKSVLKQFSFSNGKGNSVALGGHIISDKQVSFILKNTPADCEIVLAFDKDVMTKEAEGEEFIISQAQRFRPFKQVSYIFDKFNLLGEKDSPIDCGLKKWNYLLKWRKQVN